LPSINSRRKQCGSVYIIEADFILELESIQFAPSVIGKPTSEKMLSLTFPSSLASEGRC